MSDVESKSAQVLAQKLEQLEPGTPRYEALETARRFKTSWVELGEVLWGVQRKRMFERWGYPSFESYCQDEIRIKPRTAAKLTASYNFLKEEEPAVLKRDGIQRPIPDPDAVEVLRRAKEEDRLGDDEYRKIKDLALDDTPPAQLRKELKQFAPPPAPKTPKNAIKAVLAQANRLADSLAQVQGIPRVIIERALALVDDLRALVDH
jgi:hypothetical protein